jgi:hypothetical protein
LRSVTLKCIKKTMKTLLIALFALLLTACANTAKDTETARSLTEIIRAESGQTTETPKCMVPEGLVGKPNSEIQALKLTSPVRVIFPGTVIPSDQVSNRLNFKVDKKGIIKSITCG